MKTLVSVILAAFITTALAAESPAVFPVVGESYKIAVSAPLVETPYENIITVVELGAPQWAKVSFEVMTRGGKEKREMWINFSHVTSAVKKEAAKQ